ncbi:site-specific integrase [Vibrio fluvialis]|nr:site-specific integrase [Vibrio fluvialis]
MFPQKFPIYPLQLQSFKTKAKQLASYIQDMSGCIRLSNFQKNDLLSKALGYKGHSDLVQSTKSRKLADKNVPLYLFSDEHLNKQISSVICSELANIDAEVITKAVNKMVENELREKEGKASRPYRYKKSTLSIKYVSEELQIKIFKLLYDNFGIVIAALWDIGIRHGLRTSELLNIKINHIHKDDQNRTILTLYKQDYTLYNQKDSYQQILLLDKDLNIIKQLVDSNPNLVFIFELDKINHTPLKRSQLSYALKKVGNILNFHVTPQSMRHTYRHRLFSYDINTLLETEPHSIMDKYFFRHYAYKNTEQYLNDSKS